jgi:hypothetical protein
MPAVDIGVGSVAIAAAADGVLTGNHLMTTSAPRSTITLSGGTGTGTGVEFATLLWTAPRLLSIWPLTGLVRLQPSTASSTIDVTGTITVAGVFLGDD